MPNIKSAKKRVLIAKVNSERNKADKSALKTTLKKFEAAVAEGNREQADSAYQAAVQSIDKAAGKGILHKNAAFFSVLPEKKGEKRGAWLRFAAFCI